MTLVRWVSWRSFFRKQNHFGQMRTDEEPTEGRDLLSM